MPQPLKRTDFPPESKWNPEAVYPDWKAFEADFEAELPDRVFAKDALGQ